MCVGKCVIPELLGWIFYVCLHETGNGLRRLVRRTHGPLEQQRTFAKDHLRYIEII